MQTLLNLVLLFMASVLGGDNWPGFLAGNMAELTGKTPPTTWSANEGIAWKVSTPGHGQSSPVIWNDRIFVTYTDGPKKDEYCVLCLSLADGSEQWKHRFKNTEPVENSVYVSRAAPSPVVDDKRLIAFFESGDVVALDHAGNELWHRSIAEQYGKFQNKFGLSGSLVQTKDHVIALIDDEGPSYLLALDKVSGKEVWKSNRSARSSWSSPAIQTIDHVEQVIVSSAGSVDGYASDSGKLLWSYTDVGGNTGTTPLPAGPGRFFVAAGAGRDGGNSEMAKKSNMVMQVNLIDGKWIAKPIWTAGDATPSWASPIAHRGCAYWVNRTGVIYCFDLETGTLNYKERTKQSCWATPVAIGDSIYFFGKDGLTTVIAAGKDFKLISENETWDPNAVEADAKAGAKETTEERRNAAAMFSGPTQYAGVIAAGRIILRTGDAVYCIGK